jgi:hypothetical protein
MTASRWRNKKVLGSFLLLLPLLAGGGVAWTERTPLLAWYYVRGLAHANEAERDLWARRVASLGEPALPGLLDCLVQPDPTLCANAQAGLAHLVTTWGAGDGRSIALAIRLARAFPRLSPLGQRAALEVSASWFSGKGAPIAGLVPACTRLLTESAPLADAEVQSAALGLAAVLLQQPQGPEAVSAAREVARAGLSSAVPANRLRAIPLTLREGMDLLEQVVVLLNDPVVEVRRSALLAVAVGARDEALLPTLHDPDAEVRTLCENVLCSRGLRPAHLHLGRLLTDPSPRKRLQVLDHLGVASDLDPGLWLRRLSHDNSPAVRLAAVRVMSEQDLIDLSDRIDQMARSDPSPTVCQIAQFYHRQHRPASTRRY